ncbi:MAG: tetratricopeptide repeat protein, partial [Thermoproteota archaeon]|nr:tetratricopeptide repeat protein [Thermoproteota archaeon]
MEKELNPTTPEKAYFSNKVRSAVGAHINQALLTELDDAVDRQDFGTALHFLDLALLEIEQPPVEILYNKAWLLNKLGRNQEALDILNGLLTQHQDNVEVNYLKAVI